MSGISHLSDIDVFSHSSKVIARLKVRALYIEGVSCIDVRIAHIRGNHTAGMRYIGIGSIGIGASTANHEANPPRTQQARLFTDAEAFGCLGVLSGEDVDVIARIGLGQIVGYDI